MIKTSISIIASLVVGWSVWYVSSTGDIEIGLGLVACYATLSVMLSSDSLKK